MPWSPDPVGHNHEAGALEPVSYSSCARVLQILRPVHPESVPTREATTMSPCTVTGEEPPLTTTREGLLSNKTQHR